MTVHHIQRKLAAITHHSTDQLGNLNIGWAELQLICKLLRENLAYVQRHDELCHLSEQASIIGDMDWLYDICKQIEELELGGVGR